MKDKHNCHGHSHDEKHEHGKSHGHSHEKPCGGEGKNSSKFLTGTQIDPPQIKKDMTVTDLIDNTFMAYNAGRLKEACQLYAGRMLEEDVTIGVSLTGALTPAGLARSALIPLIEAGFIDWIVSTGANLYHDTHFGIGCELFQGNHTWDDTRLREEKVIRIYDIVFDYEVLLSTDRFFREILSQPEFNKEMSTAEMHYLCGKYLAERETSLGLKNSTLLATAYRAGVPVYTSSPGDSSIGMNIAALALQGKGPRIDITADVNETAAIVLNAKRTGGKSGVFIYGGGSPKNFMLQTEPQIQEVLGIDEAGHDYFVQFTDARPDTGGLSGATPAEAVSWGKVDPKALPDTVVCYVDTTIGMPLVSAYALAKHAPRKLKRLYDKRTDLLKLLKQEHEKATCAAT
ncbi:MAG TPA: deoxyhypusine synthase [Chroococcales cyanobacterium]